MKLARSDWLFALLLCVGLELAWSAQDWANLRVLRLPDTDDMMRLQQMRDWLGGQSWFDLTQHRLGLGDGLPMHWTRVNDLIPALIVSIVKPFAGAHNAELAAVLLGPAILFFGFLMLSARAALSLGSGMAAPDVTKIAILIAALAFPATGMFIPGRIDHHALQIVLLLGAVTAALGGQTSAYSREGGNPEIVSDETSAEGPGLRPAPEHKTALMAGMLAGAACALGIVVGLETVPQIVALALVNFVVRYRDRAAGAHWGYAILLGFVITLQGYAAFMMHDSPVSAVPCDSLSHDSVSVIALICWGLLFALSPDPNAFPDKRSHQILGGGIAILAGWSLVTKAYPACRAGPYSQVDPFLMRVWMGHVGEAQGLFHQSSLGIVWGYGALVLVALGVAGYTIVFLRKQEYSSQQATGPLLSQEHGEDAPKQGLSDQRLKYLLIAAPLGMSVLVMLFQLRGAYIGAGLAAPILAIWVSGLRAKGGVALAGAGLLSAGVVHHVVGDKLDALRPQAQPAAPSLSQASLGKSSGAGCTDAATMAALNQLPP